MLCSLKDATHSITIALAGAVSTVEPTYIIKQSGGPGSPADYVGLTTGDTAVVPVTGDSNGPKVIDSIQICNSDDASVTLTINKKEGDTSYPLINALVLAAKSVLVLSGNGVMVIDVNGNVNTVPGTSSVLTNLDLGASGTAGTLDVFPATAESGKLALSVTDQATDAIVSLVIGAMAAARTITLADPLAAADILTGQQAAVARTATADGTGTGTIADGGLLQFVQVTASDANHIIILPTPTPNRIVILNVGANGFELRSSAPVTVAINGGAEASAESAIAANSTVIMICVSATAWKGFFMDADGDVAKVEAAAAA